MWLRVRLRVAWIAGEEFGESPLCLTLPGCHNRYWLCNWASSRQITAAWPSVPKQVLSCFVWILRYIRHL